MRFVVIGRGDDRRASRSTSTGSRSSPGSTRRRSPGSPTSPRGTYVAPGDADPAGTVYTDLERRIVSRSEEQELTAIVAALGLLLLVAGTALSLARTGVVP